MFTRTNLLVLSETNVFILIVCVAMTTERREVHASGEGHQPTAG